MNRYVLKNPKFWWRNWTISVALHHHTMMDFCKKLAHFYVNFKKSLFGRHHRVWERNVIAYTAGFPPKLDYIQLFTNLHRWKVSSRVVFNNWPSSLHPSAETAWLPSFSFNSFISISILVSLVSVNLLNSCNCFMPSTDWNVNVKTSNQTNL